MYLASKFSQHSLCTVLKKVDLHKGSGCCRSPLATSSGDLACQFRTEKYYTQNIAPQVDRLTAEMVPPWLDFLYDGQPYAGSGKLIPAMQALKNQKNTVQALLFKTNTIVDLLHLTAEGGVSG